MMPCMHREEYGMGHIFENVSPKNDDFKMGYHKNRANIFYQSEAFATFLDLQHLIVMEILYTFEFNILYNSHLRYQSVPQIFNVRLRMISLCYIFWQNDLEKEPRRHNLTISYSNVWGKIWVLFHV